MGLAAWRALYGLKQAPRAWNKRLEGGLRANGFEQSDADPSLWIFRREDGAVLIMFYVDDGLLAAKTAAEAEALVDLVGSIDVHRWMHRYTQHLYYWVEPPVGPCCFYFFFRASGCRFQSWLNYPSAEVGDKID
jgi:hypothetical protein